MDFIALCAHLFAPLAVRPKGMFGNSRQIFAIFHWTNEIKRYK
jgi:hypothetical protein